MTPPHAASPQRGVASGFPWWLSVIIVAAIVLFAVIASSIVVAAAFFILEGPQPSVTTERLQSFQEDLMSSPLGSTMLVVPNQAVFLAASLLLGLMVGRDWRARYRLSMPRGRAWQWCAAILGTVLIGTLPSLIFSSMNEDPGPYFSDFEKWFTSPRGASAVYLVGLLALVPGVCEEFLFRGFLLSSLERRMRFPTAVLVTATCFAAAHLHPLHAVLVLPIAIWLTVIARAFDSLYIPIAAHAINNAMAVWLTMRSSAADEWSDPVAMTTLIVSGIMLVAALPGIITGLRQIPRSAPVPAEVIGESGRDAEQS